MGNTALILALLLHGCGCFVIPKQNACRRRTRNSPSTRCNLFFGKRTGIKQEEKYKELRDQMPEFPYSFNNDGEMLTIRYLDVGDLESLIPIIVQEFGTSPSEAQISWQNITLKSFEAWLDSMLFPMSVRVSLLLKIERRKDGDSPAMPDVLPDYNILCVETASGHIAGIVELSRQPLDPNRNPGPIPMPMFVKKSYCAGKRLPPPNGWVTNLLIAENCRGRGYGKILMNVVEGIAKRWGCDAIALHVDSDPRSGRIAQKLYQRLGYRPVIQNTASNRDHEAGYGWMGPSNCVSGVYMVEGIPLLFMKKKLV
mmetsp:Transcript_10693/g.16380  ORF Transcript_10693/g.16380 Transcript_10693/m.16380 type:complete len:312 (+) Transcript_10693:111-1046(+)